MSCQSQNGPNTYPLRMDMPCAQKMRIKKNPWRPIIKHLNLSAHHPTMVGAELEIGMEVLNQNGVSQSICTSISSLVKAQIRNFLPSRQFDFKYNYSVNQRNVYFYPSFCFETLKENVRKLGKKIFIYFFSQKTRRE